MNNRNRKLIPNLKIEGTIVLFKKLNILGIIWHQRANAISGHYTCTFKVIDKWFFVSDTHIQEISLSDISAYDVPYLLVFKKNYESLPLFSSRVLQFYTAHTKVRLVANIIFHEMKCRHSLIKKFASQKKK